MPARILITDDHKLLREGLRCLLENRGFEVTGEAEDGRSAIRLAKQLEPDAVIIDISLPGLNCIEATRQIHQNSPQVKIVVLSMRADSRAVLAALAAGASAYLLKEAAFEEVVIALRVALKGQTYLSPAIAHVVVQSSVQY